jgi:hypothetical protein
MQKKRTVSLGPSPKDAAEKAARELFHLLGRIGSLYCETLVCLRGGGVVRGGGGGGGGGGSEGAGEEDEILP